MLKYYQRIHKRPSFGNDLVLSVKEDNSLSSVISVAMRHNNWNNNLKDYKNYNFNYCKLDKYEEKIRGTEENFSIEDYEVFQIIYTSIKSNDYDDYEKQIENRVTLEAPIESTPIEPTHKQKEYYEVDAITIESTHKQKEYYEVDATTIESTHKRKEVDATTIESTHKQKEYYEDNYDDDPRSSQRISNNSYDDISFLQPRKYIKSKRILVRKS